MKRTETLPAVPTPFYLYEPKRLAEAARGWKEAAAGRARLFYPYKTNRHPAVLDFLARQGFGAEINIASDLPEALARGISSDRLLVQGPAKSADVIDRVIVEGGTLVADGAEDLEEILGRGRAARRPVRWLIRLRTPEARIGQRAFGVDPHDAATLARRALREGLPPLGIAFHLGTGIPSSTPYRASLRSASRTARALREIGAAPEVIDVGGGFSSPAETRFDDRGRPRRTAWTDPAKIVRGLCADARSSIGDVEVWMEPGRAIVAGAFQLVCRVLRVRGGREVFVDASRMAHAFFVARGTHEITFHPKRRGRPADLVIAGPLGTDLDVLVRRERAVPPREGDMVVFDGVGAYNMIAANQWAGPLPPVITVS
jgi:diaminopimelate decarboxylase